MPAIASLMAALGILLATGQASATEYEVTNKSAIVYAEHDGSKLVGDLYLPKGRAKAPALVAMHGGGWQAGDRTFYKYWGSFLARHGYALFAVEYRLGKAGVYPAAAYDARAAVQFVRAKAADFDIDPDRIGLIGDSAGGYLAALLALAGDRYTAAYRDDANATTPANVKAVIGFYGIYDMLAQWNHDVLGQRKREMLAQQNHDMIPRPRANITEQFLGVSPLKNRRVYLEASPISYATTDRNKPRFLLIHGSRDTLVDPSSQSGAFLAALTRAGFFARQLLIPGAGHFWVSDPFENQPHSYCALTAPDVLQFLEGSL